jgi:hypothetical protein
MGQPSTSHGHKFSIADQEAVSALIEKLSAPRGSRDVDEKRLREALDVAAGQYNRSRRELSQAFFHGLLTGCAVGLKRR